MRLEVYQWKLQEKRKNNNYKREVRFWTFYFLRKIPKKVTENGNKIEILNFFTK